MTSRMSADQRDVGTIDTTRHDGLQRLDGFPFPVLASSGVVPRARDVAARAADAVRFLAPVLDVEPDLALLVLAPEDWEARSGFPLYGMPNYVAGNVVVAGEPSDFWRSFLDLIREDDPTRLESLEETYGVDSDIDLAPFFDLLAVHEIGHLLHHTGRVRFPRLWLMELFCNLCLHGYVAEREPGALRALECFPAVLAGIAPQRFPYRSLDDFESLYDRMPPQNYGWYECRFHCAAKRIYQTNGIAALTSLWNRFRVSDAELASALVDIDPEFGRL